MKKNYLPVLFMIAAIIGICSFQFFWLRQSYLQEKKTLAIKTDFAFQHSVQELQVRKLKLDRFPADSSGKKVRVLVNDSFDQRMELRLNEGAISTINVIRKKMGSQLQADSQMKKGFIITSNHSFEKNMNDVGSMLPGDINPGDEMIRLLYGVDSLQDSMKVADITNAVGKQLKKQKIVIPFIIEREEARWRPAIKSDPEVTIGFAHPITYKMLLGKTVPYILKQILLPIIFSVLLMAITILSFLMLYRNYTRQRKLTQIKNEFIANITHELKTPIATVSVAIEAIRNFNEMHDPERTNEYLGIAGLELNRLSMLVDKVLRLSMFENKSVELKYASFNFRKLLEEVLASMSLQFEKSHTVVTTEWKNDEINGTFELNADRMHISSVLYNLLDNAIRYSNDSPQIHVETSSTRDFIICRIADKGIGIDPEYKDKIFDKFFRVPQGDVHNVKGYGLGLSYAAHIIQQHKGSIEFISDGKSGTIFIIKIPRTHAS
ncbi:MAG: HAMP domain-containing sensor histidine kinase [Ferruginibacter sp.]